LRNARFYWGDWSTLHRSWRNTPKGNTEFLPIVPLSVRPPFHPYITRASTKIFWRIRMLLNLKIQL
jgi:hypothetical protein